MKKTVILSVVLLVVAAVSTSAHAQGGIIGKMREVLKKVNEPDSEKKVEALPEKGLSEEREKEEKEGEEKEKTESKEQTEEESDMPDELKWKPDFIDEGDREDWVESASTTDEEGNTVTAYRTKDGVWIKETRDKDGNLIRVEKKIDLPNGGKKAETIDYKTGKRTQEVYDGEGKLVTSLTIDEKNKERRVAVYKGGIMTGSKSIDSQGNITRTTYNTKGRVEYSDTKDKDGKVKRTVDYEVRDNGMIVERVTDPEKGTTTKMTTAPDGSKMFRAEDTATEEMLYEAGVTVDGRILEYRTGSDADKAFAAGEVISTAKYSGTQDMMSGEEEAAEEFYHREQSVLDKRLEDQMTSGVSVGGESIIVSTTFKERTLASRKEDEQGWQETGIERMATSSEIRDIDPDGPYKVKSLGKPISAEGYGISPSEALSSALNAAAGNVINKIESEFLDHTRSVKKTGGGKPAEEKFEEQISNDLDTSSFVVFEGYEVESVGMEDGNYVVKVRAKPGVIERK